MVLGHRIHGNGPEKAFLYNDWLASAESWDPTLPYLDTERFTYVLTDLRGYGESLDQTGDYNEVEGAADTLALADHLGYDKFHLVGFSMTGMVVERLAIDAPERIKSVVAIGPVSAAGIKMSEAERQFFVDVITNDDKARELADRITGGSCPPRQTSSCPRRETRPVGRGLSRHVTLHDSRTSGPITALPGHGLPLDSRISSKRHAHTSQWHKTSSVMMIRPLPMQEMPTGCRLMKLHDKHPAERHGGPRRRAEPRKALPPYRKRRPVRKPIAVGQ